MIRRNFLKTLFGGAAAVAVGGVALGCEAVDDESVDDHVIMGRPHGMTERGALAALANANGCAPWPRAADRMREMCPAM